jgi:hypothetical protein
MVKKLLKKIIILVLVFVLLVFCKLQFIGKNFDAAAFESYIFKPSTTPHSIRLTYLGTSGFIIDYKGNQFVCDPFFSNPNLISSAFGNIPYPELSERIDSNLYNNVQLITISHGHYDHCLDIGNFLNAKSNTTIIADPSDLNELSSLFTNKNVRLAPVPRGEKKKWIYAADSSFRVFDLPSTHSPHFCNVTLFTGIYAEPLYELPAKLWNWKLCQCNSYLIDILDHDTVYYRILMCTGNMNKDGIDDLEQLSKERKADLLLHIFWKNKECKKNLENCYTIAQPKLVILHHWNNFFRSNDKSLQYLRSCEFPESIDELQKEGIMGKIMIPFTSVEL